MWVGLTDSAAAAWFVHHLLYLPVVYLWTLSEPATLLSDFSDLIFSECLFYSLIPSPAAQESTSLFLQLAPLFNP